MHGAAKIFCRLHETENAASLDPAPITRQVNAPMPSLRNVTINAMSSLARGRCHGGRMHHVTLTTYYEHVVARVAANLHLGRQ